MYCSDIVGREVKYNCRNVAYRRRAIAARKKDLITKPCLLCEKMFKAKHDKREKYCRKPCTWHIAHYGVTVNHTYDCMVCGKEFKSVRTRAWAKYCHSPCTPSTMKAINRKKLHQKKVGRPSK
jgi:hypothetical protein